MNDYQQDIFYKTQNLGLSEKKELLKYANELSYDTSVQQIQPKSFQRKRIDKTFEWFLTILKNSDHFVVIHRKGYNDPYYGEIGVRTMDMNDYFLYINVTEEDLQKIVNKFNLESRYK